MAAESQYYGQALLLWQSVLDMMAPLCSKEDNLVLGSLTLKTKSEKEWILLAPNKFACEQIRASLFDALQMFLGNKGIKKVKVEVASTPDLFVSDASTPAPFESNLISDYQFHNFVEAPSNHEAFAAAERVSSGAFLADSNPLLIYGGTGLGKSHLMHAAGNALRRNGRAAVMYMNAEQFVNEFVAAISGKSQRAFSKRLRSVDALLIDDVQFLGGKEQSQAEFFHTFNELIDKKRQIVMTCDRYPKEIEGLQARLKSRFGAGLSVSIRTPEPETRFAILKSKAKEQSFTLPDEVAYFIAERVESNVRDLEGALKKLIFQCRVLKNDAPATLAVAQSALADLLQAQKKQTSVENILRVVAQYYAISADELLSRSRKKTFAEPRMLAMALTRELTDLSLKAIAQAYQRKDHSTVMHAVENMEKRRQSEPRFREEYDNIRTIITA